MSAMTRQETIIDLKRGQSAELQFLRSFMKRQEQRQPDTLQEKVSTGNNP